MTIRLLSTYDGFAPQSIITLDSALETALIAGGNATATLTGGTVAYRERQPVMIQPAVQKRGAVNLIANRKAIVPLTEGSALTITPTAGTTGTYQRYDAAGAAVGALTTIGTTPLTVGAFEGDFTVEIKCTTGTMAVKVGDGVVPASRKINSIYKKPGRKATRQVATRMAAVANGTIGWCYHNNFTVEADVVAIRPTLNNVHTAALTGVVISVAPTADFSLVNAPSGAWVNGTFGNGAASSGTAAARLAAEQPSLTRPDWIMLNSVVPTDKGSLRYFCARHFVPAVNATTSEGNYDLSTLLHVPSALNAGRIFQTFRQDVDGVSNKAAFTSTTPYGKPGLIMGWDYLLASGEIRTVGGFGDSIMEGAVNGAGGNFGNGWLYQAIQEFRRQHPDVLIEHANYGIATQNTTTFNQLAVERIPRVDPDVIVYSPFSPNDGTPTAATLNVQATLNVAMQTAAKTANSPVIYALGCPNTQLAWTPTQDLFRRYSNIFFQGEQRMSFNVVAMDPDLWDGVSAFKPEVTTDLTHPNEYGAGLVGVNQGYPALRKAILGY